MELKDIIKNDNDRLFIIDNECFIIFTGDTTDDEKPFIRIGNWLDLPVQCIPLIENIIIPDIIIGNPALEQFNINPRNLSSNKYIGSEQIVKGYLNFQKNFNLDLNNATIVDVEKDLPVLSKEKIIFNTGAIIGVFYHDGNFKIVYNGEDIFNLKDIEDKTHTDIKKHDQLSLRNRETTRYSGTGLFQIEGNPIFYKNGFFTSYQFPGKYLTAFSQLNIDPSQIREILLPAPNLLNITGFIKWKNSIGGRLKLYSDIEDKFSLMQAFFQDTGLIRNDFKDLSFNTGDGLSVENYSGTINIRLSYINVKPSYEDIQIAFIRDYSGLHEILDETLDAIFVSYTIFEQAVLFFKSVQTPIAVISDGNKNMSRLQGRDHVIINSGIQYEFMKYENIDNLLQDASKLVSDKDIISRIIGMEDGDINKILQTDTQSNEVLPFDKLGEIFNIASILKVYLDTTTDRKFAHKMRDAFKKVDVLINRESIHNQNKSCFRISLFFYNSSIYEFIEMNKEATAENIPIQNEITDDTMEMLRKSGEQDQKELYERIINDRKRLNDLLELYKKIHKKKKKDIHHLENDIANRKKQLISEDIKIDNSDIKKDIFGIRFKKFGKIFILLIAVLLIFFISLEGYKYYNDYKDRTRIEEEKRLLAEEESKRIEEEITRKQRKKDERKELIKRYSIHVSDRDIYKYANKVARKNGYKEITFRALKEKNPNWIFPGNVFTMLDGEKVVVKWGDTLWDFSDKKLMHINVEFYKLIDNIKEAKESGKDTKAYIKKARELAFNKKHHRMLDSISRNK